MKTIFILLISILYLHSLELDKAKKYINQDVNGWMMSEKLDGIRAYWNGKELLSKNGNKIYAPLKFTKNFPPFELDGELWTKRNDFENIQSIVLDKKPSKHWSLITYNIFESPNSSGNYLKRLEKVKIWFNKNENKNIKIIKQIKVKSKKELYLHLENVLKLKGEGLMLKNPKLDYINKRNKNSLKVKTFYDQEGLVKKINYNKNKLMKSLVLQLDSGVIFNLGGGFSLKNRENPPKVGDMVTFKYYGLTKNNKPKFASFLRVRQKE